MAKKNGIAAKRRKWGSKGGKIGGPARAKALSKSRRIEIASLAAKARWANASR